MFSGLLLTSKGTVNLLLGTVDSLFTKSGLFFTSIQWPVLYQCSVACSLPVLNGPLLTRTGTVNLNEKTVKFTAPGVDYMSGPSFPTRSFIFYGWPILN